MAVGLAEHGRRTVGAIHMKPQAFALGKIREQIQVIVSPAAGGAGAAHRPPPRVEGHVAFNCANA